MTINANIFVSEKEEYYEQETKKQNFKMEYHAHINNILHIRFG